ncbi:MAG: DUF4160 domain-containing protein [Oscillospiraceae bacterium]|nr:DUF4160 domain-containing protein [Candidatus Limimonas egerieequi]
MPELTRFNNIIIYMYFTDNDKHHKPHIHVKYNGQEVILGIDGTKLRGDIPRKQLRKVRKWIKIHEEELYDAWNKAVRGMEFDSIDPYKE